MLTTEFRKGGNFCVLLWSRKPSKKVGLEISLGVCMEFRKIIGHSCTQEGLSTWTIARKKVWREELLDFRTLSILILQKEYSSSPLCTVSVTPVNCYLEAGDSPPDVSSEGQ